MYLEKNLQRPHMYLVYSQKKMYQGKDEYLLSSVVTHLSLTL